MCTGLSPLWTASTRRLAQHRGHGRTHRHVINACGLKYRAGAVLPEEERRFAATLRGSRPDADHLGNSPTWPARGEGPPAVRCDRDPGGQRRSPPPGTARESEPQPEVAPADNPIRSPRGISGARQRGPGPPPAPRAVARATGHAAEPAPPPTRRHCPTWLFLRGSARAASAPSWPQP